MRPAQIFFFFFIVFLVLASLQLIVPETFTVQNIPIKVFRFAKTVLPNHEKIEGQKEKLIKLQQKTEALLVSDSIVKDFSNAKGTPFDTSGEAIVPEVSFQIDSGSGIQYPSGDTTILYPFFALLDSAKSKGELIRILHFGDSQIEGDRISGYLRQRFQQQFGGCGPGLVPFSESESSRFSVEIKSEKPINRYFMYGKQNPAGHKYYSVLHSLFRLNNDSINPQLAISNSIRYKLRSNGFKRASYFNKATLLMRNSKTEVEIGTELPENQNLKFTIKPSDTLNAIELPIKRNLNRLKLDLKSSPENDFFGICLDCKAGVAIDNIPLRGSSGLELIKIKPEFLQEQIKKLNVKLVILQFGVNVVPYESPGFGWYEANLIKAIHTIKRAKSGVQVLVIGVSDIAKRQDGVWQSYPNINLIREAQRNAAKKTNSAFWDLFQVMGGQNSILAWASTNPPLAGKDYVHMTPKGAQVIGEFLFQSITTDYKKFKTTKEKQIL